MIEIKENIDIKKMTTFGISAQCGHLIEFSDPIVDLPELYKQGLLADALIIGGGSNMLFTADAPQLTVVHPVASKISLEGITPDGAVLVRADAGVVLDDLCSQTTKEGYWGLENLSGIPGHIGGAAVQNVGAYGTEFKDVVESVTCFDTNTGQFVTLSKKECEYGYRDSVFKHSDRAGRLIVCFVTLRLSRAYAPNLEYTPLRSRLAKTVSLTPEKVRDTVMEIRDGKLPDPKTVGSAGSFFKNPVIQGDMLNDVIDRWNQHPESEQNPLKYFQLPDNSVKLSAAWLIDKAGCKSLSEGDASLWPTQPLVIVNTNGDATGQDIVRLEQRIIARVRDVFGIELSPEVVHI